MATAPAANNLPLFYKDLVPLNSVEHGDWRARTLEKADFLVDQHAIPLTIEEFIPASRFFPIVFSTGDESVPLALMGMNEGVNVFVDNEGQFTAPVYVPAYVRRYPFMLARLQPDSQELSLCFDPQSGNIGKFEDGEVLFEDAQPTERVMNMLKFCEDFEQAGVNTQAFVAELNKLELLIDGEVSIQQDGIDAPFIYRGFKMVDEKKLQELRGDTVRKLNQNGILPLVYAHLFSLNLVREVFAAQAAQGKAPEATVEPAA